MIYIVEIPHQMPPKAWSRSTKEAIMEAIDLAANGCVVYDAATGADLLDTFGYTSTDEMRSDNESLLGLADQIDKRGATATFYRGFPEDEYGSDPIDQWATYLDWNGHDLSRQMVFMTDEEAQAALDNDSAWKCHQGIEARAALREELES
ncbi:hypothetical protein A3709_19410 [Halioglobus sp. HI00S01]|uniref:hypothetical protein n=1 Tax=Halioglobus sp. HI00S01 TaxID=1822214 RepID=UPI0007C35975|nr:hypothetical protein [Halioglobus sp. HI00S01]KZX57793.1 hypothetical protein A3709_19410 [Halioglobus sp. HI00S01]